MKYAQLKALCLSLIIGNTLLAQKDLNADSLAFKLDTYLSKSVANGYSGSVLVAKEGEIVFSKGYGWADRSLKIRNTPATVFNIGSVTKQFTAAAILKLMEDQKLDVSDNIEKYFPQAPFDKKDITIHQLLTHTSGVSPSTGGFRYDKASKETFLNDFFESELMYLPGTKHTYANANYILLTAIVEQVAQQDYETFLRNNFWTPLQMNHTGYKGITFDSEQLAHGYYFHYTDGEWRDWGTTQEHLPYNNEHWYSIGKGDIYSTVEDLYTWHRALENNKVLSSETIKLMEEDHVPENETQTSFYGYDWAIFNSKNNSKIVAHNGSNGIYFADFLRFVEDDLVIIALSNVILNQKSENVAWEIASMVLDEEYSPKTIPKNKYELVFDFIRSNTPDKASQLPQFIETKSGTTINDKALLNRIGFKQVSENRDTDWGISLLKLNTRLFPGDGNLWDSLGEGYYIINDRKKAVESFERAMELGPETNCYWCENATKRLEELNNK